MLSTPTLDGIPQEILEHIAFCTVTSEFLGPPAAIIPLLLTNRRFNTILSLSSNPHLYARIFAFKFDLAPVIRRLGPGHISPAVLSAELQSRCTHLTRVRRRTDTKIIQFSIIQYDEEMVHTILWMGHLMMLENKGKNEQQLRNYAEMDVWLKEYWFDPQGASFATLSIKMDKWPPNNEKNSLAMWLFWFLLNPDAYKSDQAFRNATTILKLLALGAHQYQLCSPPWTEFLPDARGRNSYRPLLYAENQCFTPPPLALPAILSFLTLSGALAFSRQGVDWDNERERCLSLGRTSFHTLPCSVFTPGSIQGLWEGIFSYMEFTSYAALLAGAPPPVLHKSFVAQHRQTWKLREYHLLAPVSSSSSSDSSIKIDTDGPLSVGDPIQAFFPEGSEIDENPGGIVVRDPGKNNPLFYHKVSRAMAPSTANDINCNCNGTIVQDILIVGEGHSAWGQFSLHGRVRPCDGFVSLCKEYVDGERGKWLYRGYLVGNVNGNIGGRWRDTLTPPDVPGYEGTFAMSRRQ